MTIKEISRSIMRYYGYGKPSQVVGVVLKRVLKKLGKT